MMTKEQMRIAIAEKCGWKYVEGEEPLYGRPFYQAHWLSPKGRKYETDWRSKTTTGLPNYPEDLNAMHEAEKVLGDQIYNYTLWLIKILNWSARRESTFVLIHVTASQRAEAFCRVFWPERWKNCEI